MTYELATGHNPYAMFGGARVADYASLAVRDDRFRAQGPFGHSILAGTFGAILLPLFVALWWKARKHRMIAVMGVISATVITVACNSSTPVLGYAAGVAGSLRVALRQWMRAIRWGIVFTLVCLQLVLKAPVWHLIIQDRHYRWVVVLASVHAGRPMHPSFRGLVAGRRKGHKCLGL